MSVNVPYRAFLLLSLLFVLLIQKVDCFLQERIMKMTEMGPMMHEAFWVLFEWFCLRCVHGCFWDQE